MFILIILIVYCCVTNYAKSGRLKQQNSLCSQIFPLPLEKAAQLCSLRGWEQESPEARSLTHTSETHAGKIQTIEGWDCQVFISLSHVVSY